MRFAFASILSALAAVATAYTQPDYSKAPTGNPILTPGLNQQVPVGKPFSITWTPTTPGEVSLVLLRGPSNNVKPLYPIVENIPNTGKYDWTPSTTLENDVTHYGILLVVEGTGQYQYSTQFGISNPQGSNSASQSSQEQATTTTATVIPATTSDVTVILTETTTECPETTSPAAPTTPPAATTSVPVIPSAKPTTMQTATSVAVPSAPGNPAPTNPPAAPTTPSGPVFTGSGNRNALSMGAVAAAAFAVLAF